MKKKFEEFKKRIDSKLYVTHINEFFYELIQEAYKEGYKDGKSEKNTT